MDLRRSQMGMGEGMTKRILTPEQYAARQSRTVERLRYEPKTALGLCNQGAAQSIDAGIAQGAGNVGARRRRRSGKPGAPRISEHAEQVAVIQWWGSYCGTVGLDERLLMAIPNAAKRSPRTGSAMKAEGLRPGCPDLMLAVPMRTEQHGRVPLFHGMFCELKATDGKARDNQIDYADVLRKAGYNCVIVYGADEAIRAIKAYVERAK